MNNIIQLIAEKVKDTIEESVIKVLEGETKLDNVVDLVGDMVNNIGLDTIGAIIDELNDIVKLKKKHPCGSFEWEVLRVGADFRLKCIGCGHQLMMARTLVEKNLKGIRKQDQ